MGIIDQTIHPFSKDIHAPFVQDAFKPLTVSSASARERLG